MADLLVIIPSRGRPSNMVRVVEAWHHTDAFEHAALLFAIDADDPEGPAYVDAVSELRCAGLTLTMGARRQMAPRTNIEAAQRANRYFALGSAGDDHLPRTPGWAKRYLDELTDLGTGVVYGDDGLQGENLCTEWAMTADIVRALGRMIPAPVGHMYSDNAVMDLAREAGCLRWLPDVHIQHMHPVAGRSAWDEHYRRVNSGDQFARDGAAWQQWVTTGLANDATKVRALREPA